METWIVDLFIVVAGVSACVLIVAPCLRVFFTPNGVT